jgi:hypothetical protein
VIGREWRITACDRCWWRDYYLLFNSYPPRCPKCGSDVGHEFSIQVDRLSSELRRTMGRDDGVRMEFRHSMVPVRRAREMGWM